MPVSEGAKMRLKGDLHRVSKERLKGVWGLFCYRWNKDSGTSNSLQDACKAFRTGGFSYSAISSVLARLELAGEKEPFDEPLRSRLIQFCEQMEENWAKPLDKRGDRKDPLEAKFVERIFNTKNTTRNVDSRSLLTLVMVLGVHPREFCEESEFLKPPTQLKEFSSNDAPEVPDSKSIGADASLAIALQPTHPKKTTTFRVDAELVDTGGERRRIADGTTDSVPLEQVPRTVRSLMDSAASVARQVGHEGPLHVDLFVPIKMLSWDLDELLGCVACVRPAHADHHVVLRAVARLRGAVDESDPYGDLAVSSGWREYWERCRPCLDEPLTAARADRALRAIANHAHCRAVLDQNACVLLLGFSPMRSGQELSLMLSDGASVIAWASRIAPEDFQTELQQRLCRTGQGASRTPCLRDLPKTLRDMRWQSHNSTAMAEGNPHTGGYHLIWDDPDRMPKFSWSEQSEALPFESALDRQPQ
jgi:hypothetical protein